MAMMSCKSYSCKFINDCLLRSSHWGNRTADLVDFFVINFLSHYIHMQLLTFKVNLEILLLLHLHFLYLLWFQQDNITKFEEIRKDYFT